MKHLLHKRPIPILLTVVLLGMIPLMFFSAHAVRGSERRAVYDHVAGGRCSVRGRLCKR